jgi:transglutaminase-like putative cysteine protease
VLKSLAAAAAILAWGMFGASLARADDKPVYAPPAKWVQQAPIPAAPDDGQPPPAVQMLLDDNQALADPQGFTYYNRRVVRIAKPEGLAGSGSRSMTWDPARETLTLHGLSIVRNGQTIDLLKGGKDVLVLRREKNMERAMLDGRMTASLQLNDLQVGDVVDWSYSLQHNEPLFGGRANDSERMGWAGAAARYRVRLLWPDGVPMAWKATAGFPEPKVSISGKTHELLVDVANVTAPRPPVGAPARFQRVGQLEASTFRDWNEISARMAPLFTEASTLAADSPLKAEAATIAAASHDPKVRAFAALQLVEDKTRYLFLGMGEGGYRPTPADETWSRRFGDCKAKTVLLLALLRELGVQAEPVLVATAGGDGLDLRVPAAAQFNHVLVRAHIDGADYWLDGTRTGDRGGLATLRPPGYRWGLPIQAGGAGLVEIVQPTLTLPDSEVVLRIDASAGLDAPAPTRMTTTVRGEGARAIGRMTEAASRADIERALKQSFSSSLSWIDFKTVDWSRADDGTMTVNLAGDATLDWRLNDDLGVREFQIPGTGDGQAKALPRRQPGPDSDAPYAVAYPTFSKGVFEIVLPNAGKGFSIKGPNAEAVIGGARSVQASALSGGIARFERETVSQAREIPFAAVEETNRQLRNAAAEAKIVRAPKGL